MANEELLLVLAALLALWLAFRVASRRARSKSREDAMTAAYKQMARNSAVKSSGGRVSGRKNKKRKR